MSHWTRFVISTALIGTGIAVIMAVIGYQLGYNSDPLVLGWVFGVLAMGAVVMCNDNISPTATGGT